MAGEVSSAYRTVLIVEDAETCATTLEVAFLDIPGVTIASVASGQEALRLLRDEKCSVGALVTDLHMPRMDGFELIERVRADGRHAALPIIVISGDTDPHTPERILRIGADAYFGKPYSPAQVRRKLEQLLDANRTRNVP